jgi:hypothetical protein
MEEAIHTAANSSGSSAACVHDCINLGMLHNPKKGCEELKIL